MALKSRKISSGTILHKGYKTPKLQGSMEKTTNIDFQVHPFLFLGRTKVKDIANMMQEKDLFAVAIGELNSNIFPEMIRQSSEIPNAVVDDAGIMFHDESANKNRYIFRFTEYDTKEGFQVLTLGYHLNGKRPRMEIRRIIDSALEPGAPVYFDHATTSEDTLKDISEEKTEEVKKLCIEYDGKLKLDYNGTNHPLVRWFVKQFLNIGGAGIREHDTNRSVEKLVEELSERYDINVPIVAYTDLHARTPGLLKDMGTTGIKIDENRIQGYTPREVLSSIDNLIMLGETVNGVEKGYKNIRKYLPLSHDIKAYGVPFIANKLSGGLLGPRPRS